MFNFSFLGLSKCFLGGDVYIGHIIVGSPVYIIDMSPFM